MNEVVVGVILGAGLSIVSSIVVAFVAERRARVEWRRQTRLEAARKIVRAFQAHNREITSLAISDADAIDGSATDWRSFHATTIDWNAARHEAALVSPVAELRIIDQLDRELDRVLEVATGATWKTTDFRKERIRLGELLGEYIRLARKSASEGDIPLASGWHWASDELEAPRPLTPSKAA